jgi:hypothetical protein
MIGARYAYVPVRLPATNGERRFSVHALQGVLAWGFGDNLSGPFRHLERAISYEVAVPIGIIVDQGAPAGGAAFAAGVEIRMMFHL